MSDQADDSEFERAARAAAERRLVEAAVAGSVVAFEELYRLHVRKVHGLCLRMTGQRETAEDCTQEAFIQAWKALPRFEARSSFGTWLHRIAVNAVLAQARRRGEKVGAEASVDETLAETAADPTQGDPGDGRDLEAVIASLPPGARHVLVLAGVYGYSHEETAGMLGVAVGTCKAQLHRARRLLGERLAAADPA
ncbi:MAG: RNA polymerase sigma factor [Steroidobacteraceae bacterium]